MLLCVPHEIHLLHSSSLFHFLFSYILYLFHFFLYEWSIFHRTENTYSTYVCDIVIIVWSIFKSHLYTDVYYYILLLMYEASADERPTGDQEVAGSTPAAVGNILSWRLTMKYFLRSFSPFRWLKKDSCQFLAKECAAWRTKPAQ